MNPVVEGYFTILAEDLAAAKQLAASVPRASAFHLQQAAEKLVKALLAAEGIHVGTAHDIASLVGRLPDGHEWRADLTELDTLSRYATAYRYPSSSGRIAPPPDRAALERHALLVETLAGEIGVWCRER